MFSSSDFPVHVTIVRPFLSGIDEKEIIKKMKITSSKNKPMKTSGKSKEMFGPQNNVFVTELENTPEIQKLHNDSLDDLGDSINFELPQYNSNFRPHVTDQKTGKISVGEEIFINSISLLRFYENKCHIIDTVDL